MDPRRLPQRSKIARDRAPQDRRLNPRPKEILEMAQKLYAKAK